MKRALVLSLLFPKTEDLKYILETTSTSIYDGNSRIFTSDGLYSNTIYGVIGSDDRNRLFSYKKLGGIRLLHPRIFINLLTLNSMFEKIVTGKIFVIFDEDTKNYILSDISEGHTGISYFMEHVMDVELVKNESDTRNQVIDVINKYRSKGELFIENMWILPAGMREYRVNEGKPDEEDEINDFYKSLIRLSTAIEVSSVSKEDQYIIDPTILKLQNTIVDIYTYIMFLMDGKKKMIRGKWQSSPVDGGTRNILSSTPINIDDLDDTDSFIGFNDTSMGVYQYMMSHQEMIQFQFRTLFVERILNFENTTMKLYDMDAKKFKQVKTSRKIYELWSTVDGVTSLMSKVATDDNKDTDISINGKYPFMVSDLNGVITLLFGTIDKDTVVRPLTYGELFMIVATTIVDKTAGTVTRYPITTDGNIYLTNFKIYSTTNSRAVTVKIPREIEGEDIIKVQRYPIRYGNWINTMAPHYSRIEPLGADFDGDKGNSLPLDSLEAVKGVKAKFKDLSHYVNTSGKPTYSLADSMGGLVVSTLTQ